jgi:hypothetical protein
VVRREPPRSFGGRAEAPRGPVALTKGSTIVRNFSRDFTLLAHPRAVTKRLAHGVVPWPVPVLKKSA